MPRSKIDGSLRSYFRDYLFDFHWQPIETGMTSKGVPDSNFCYKGIEGWIEHKQTEGWAVTFQPGQVGWLEKRERYGGRTFVAIRRQNSTIKGGGVDALYIVPGTWARLISEHGLQSVAEDPPFLSLGGPQKWDWLAVREFLLAR